MVSAESDLKQAWSQATVKNNMFHDHDDREVFFNILSFDAIAANSNSYVFCLTRPWIKSIASYH